MAADEPEGSVQATQPEVGQETARLLAQFSFASSFSSPFLPPAVLEEYERVLPGTAERLIAMAEAQSAHRKAMEEKKLNAEIADAKADRNEAERGQYCGLAIGITAIISGAVVAGTGHEWAGGFIGSAGVIGLVTAFIYGRQKAPAKPTQAPAQPPAKRDPS